MSVTKSKSIPAVIGTIGRLDIGETFGFQTARTLKVGDTFSLKVQVPKNSPPYGTARVQTFRPEKPYNWILAYRIS